MPKFSVVIAVYNKEKYIGATLQSVLDQTFTDFEVVIVNDGSTDNSEARIQQFDDPRIRFYSEDNRGAGGARNFVIEKAQGDYIALLDADDEWDPTYLAEFDGMIRLFPNEHMFATAYYYKKSNRDIHPSYSLPEDFDSPQVVNFFEASLMDSLLSSSSTVVKRNVFSEVGNYNPGIKSGQDTDLFVRLGIKYPVVFSDKPLVCYHIIENSLFRSTRSVVDKPDFNQYLKEEATNPALKKFLDLNRYSLCILARLEGNREAFDRYRQQLDPSNLNRKQRFLLNQNAATLRGFMAVKKGMDRLGLRLTAFK